MHTAPATPAPIDINAAIVRYVAGHQPCRFAELAELFTEPPPSGPVNRAHLQALTARLIALCACGQLQRLAPPRFTARRQTAKHRAPYIVGNAHPHHPHHATNPQP